MSYKRDLYCVIHDCRQHTSNISRKLAQDLSSVSLLSSRSCVLPPVDRPSFSADVREEEDTQREKRERRRERETRCPPPPNTEPERRTCPGKLVFLEQPLIRVVYNTVHTLRAAIFRSLRSFARRSIFGEAYLGNICLSLSDLERRTA